MFIILLGGNTLNKEQIAHDLALIVVENILEDIDNEYGVKQYSSEVVDIYNQAKEIILKELD